jgi:serine/threonine protein kinase
MTNERLGMEINGPNAERFRIEARLGNGSFGEVYKAIGLASGLAAAVKMIPHEELNDPSTLSKRTILNEVRLSMMTIDHPNVVRVLHVDEGTDTEKGPIVMMEYVEGGTLHQYLELKRSNGESLLLNEALALMRGIVLGAQAINEHLIHRDIKPDNILLEGAAPTPRPKIADFGIAKVVLEQTRPGTFKGVQHVWYMAPEVWRREKNTPRIDVYSVGLVFYEILTLNHPLLSHVSDPSDWTEWREVHLNIPCPDVRESRVDVPLSLAKLLLRMTDKSPGNRPGWDDILAGLNVPGVQPKPQTTIDPRLLAAFKSQADERFREDKARLTADLTRQQKADRDSGRREEYNKSAIRLLANFDEVIKALNQHEPSYPIQDRTNRDLSRTFLLPNERELRCEIFGYLADSPKASHYNVLGGGYVGVAGGLSMNLALFGSHDDIANSNWSAVEATANAIFYGEKRLDLYREARLSDEAIRFLEFFDHDQMWRRDCPTFFGFEDANLFYEHFVSSIGAMHVYSFRARPDVIDAFNEVLKIGLLMPRKR